VPGLRKELEMALVYIVTAGELDEYGIVACFSEKTQAERLRDAYNKKDPLADYETADIEEWELDPQDPKWMRETL
jgi:hypothetical protein